MVEDGRLSFETATPQQLCLVSVAYNNLAIVQLRLEVPDLACRSSQNARRVARLCLSHSTRWIATLQKTQEVARQDLRYLLSTTVITDRNRGHLELLQKLLDNMYV